MSIWNLGVKLIDMYLKGRKMDHAILGKKYGKNWGGKNIK